METSRCTCSLLGYRSGFEARASFLLCMSAQEHTFDGKENACGLAYSAVQVPAGYSSGTWFRDVQRLFPKPSDAPAQVECDVCRACTIQEAGCGDQGPGSDPYDCSTAATDGSSCHELLGAVGLLAEAMPLWATGPGLGPERATEGEHLS